MPVVPARPFLPSRRLALNAGLALGALPWLSACERTPTQAAFKGMDLTGADYGKELDLDDPTGRRRSLADFRGKVLLVFFGFTQCPDVCPTALARAVEVRQGLGADGAKLQVLFVSVDPERDTGPVLAEYTKAFDPDFLALRGDAARTEAAAKAFKVFYRRVPTGSSYTMDHTALSYLIDPQGRLRVAVRHGQPATEIIADVRELLAGR
jgi:protein SCO1/2